MIDGLTALGQGFYLAYGHFSGHLAVLWLLMTVTLLPAQCLLRINHNFGQVRCQVHVPISLTSPVV